MGLLKTGWSWKNRLFGHGQVGGQLRSQAPLQLLAQFGYFHAGHHDEFAAQHLARFVVVGQLARYTTILAFLVPTEPSIRNRFRANELEAAQKTVALRHLKFLAQDGNVHKLFVRTERFRHDRVLFSAHQMPRKSGIPCTDAPRLVSAIRVDRACGSDNETSSGSCQCATGWLTAKYVHASNAQPKSKY